MGGDRYSSGLPPRRRCVRIEPRPPRISAVYYYCLLGDSDPLLKRSGVFVVLCLCDWGRMTGPGLVPMSDAGSSRVIQIRAFIPCYLPSFSLIICGFGWKMLCRCPFGDESTLFLALPLR